MELGVVFPTTDIGTDPATVAEYARTAEDLGYGHLMTYDHVVGANPDRPNWEGHYDYEDPFHEPLTLFGYLAGVTDSIDLVTGILVLPQRQTVLVAKQVAELDVLTGGRLRFGCGVGWNPVEYEALGFDETKRGRRIEEQIEVLRALWSEPLVTFDGEWHTIDDAGISPLPIQQPMPIWMGGGADVVLRRAARVADGWLPKGKWRRPENPLTDLEPDRDRLFGYLREAGRDPSSFPIAGRIDLADDPPGRWVERVRAWRDFGASHLAVDTMDMAGLEGPADHIEAIRRFKETVDDAGVGA